MKTIPAIASAGIVAKITKVMSQPVTNANTNPAMSVPIVMMRVDIFSPMAPWNAKVSLANLDAN